MMEPFSLASVLNPASQSSQETQHGENEVVEQHSRPMELSTRNRRRGSDPYAKPSELLQLIGPMGKEVVKIAGISLVYLEVTNRGLPGRGSGTSFPTVLRSLRSFSDDGNSELVNVLGPGYGHCLVQRADLVFDEFNSEEGSLRGVTTLSIGFDKDRRSIATGLPRFIEAVGGP